MPETNHTPEPWVYRETYNGDIVHYVGTGTTYRTVASYVDPPDAARIVACVNGCRGINPEAVRELLEACEAAVNAFEIEVPTGNEVVAQLRAAIAKATQGE